MKIYVNVLLLHTYVFKKCVTYCGLIFDLNHNIHEYVHGCICVQMCVCEHGHVGKLPGHASQ